MKKYGHGCPAKLFEKGRRNECHKWNEILEKIAKGFNATEKIKNNYLWKGKRFEKLNREQKEGMRLFVKFFNSLWD